MAKIIYVNPSKCTGCLMCESVCSIHHEDVLNTSKSRINVVKWENEGIFIPMLCQQCIDPVCLTICKFEAIYHDKETGRVLIDYELCKGCRLCVTHCPFGAVNITPDKKIIKCDQCNGDPQCVKNCRPGALQYIEESNLSLQKRKISAKEFYQLIRNK